MRKFLRIVALTLWLVSGGKLFWWGIRKFYRSLQQVFASMFPDPVEVRAKRLKLKKKYRYLLEHGQDVKDVRTLFKKSVRFEKAFAFLAVLFGLLLSVMAIYVGWHIWTYWDHKLF